MPSARRIRLLGLAAVVTVFFVFFYGTGFGRSSNSGKSADFYHKTMDAMRGSGNAPGQTVINAETGKKAGHIPADTDGDGDIDEDDKKASKELQDRLSKLAQEAKDNANEKAGPKPDAPSKLVGVGNSAEGNRKPPGDDAKKADDAAKSADAAAAGDGAPVEKSKEKARVPESPAEIALYDILKKAPVIIFSKSYCPHSKRAKGILLEKYVIIPKPYIVELDEHELGSQIQDVLEGLTSRRTVPNIMVNRVSIGGADNIVELDNKGELISKIKGLGKGKIEISEHFSAEQVKGAAPAGH